MRPGRRKEEEEEETNTAPQQHSHSAVSGRCEREALVVRMLCASAALTRLLGKSGRLSFFEIFLVFRFI